MLIGVLGAIFMALHQSAGSPQPKFVKAIWLTLAASNSAPLLGRPDMYFILTFLALLLALWMFASRYAWEEHGD